MVSVTNFLSYSRSNSEFAVKLAKDLKKSGIDIWIDQLDIEPGSRWDRSIQEALNTSKRMLVIFTPESISSNNVMDEVSFALEKGKKVIPILLEPCEIPFRLRRLQHIDFTESYDDGLQKLTAFIKQKSNAKLKDETVESTDDIPTESKIKDDSETGQTSKMIEEVTRERHESVDKSSEFAKSSSPKKARFKTPLIVVGILVLASIMIWAFMNWGSSDNFNPDSIDDGNVDVEEKSIESQDWNAAMDDATIAGYKKYMDNYPNGIYFEQAQGIIEGIEDDLLWKSVLADNSKAAYVNYISKYPNGKWIENAKSNLKALDDIIDKNEQIKIKEEDLAWNKAKSENTIESYQNYISSYPNGRYTGDANNHKTAIANARQPANFNGVYRIRIKANNTYLHADGFGDKLISTRAQETDDFTRFIFEREPDNSYTIRVKADNLFLHEDGFGDKLISTRHQPNDDFTRFYIEAEPDGAVRIKVKANDRYWHLDGMGDKLLSTRAQETDDFTKFYLERQ